MGFGAGLKINRKGMRDRKREESRKKNMGSGRQKVGYWNRAYTSTTSVHYSLIYIERAKCFSEGVGTGARLLREKHDTTLREHIYPRMKRVYTSLLREEEE